MLANFSVQNFRSIKNKVTLSFEATKTDELEDYYILTPKEGVRLLKLGLIYGANASGKTNLLRSLDFLRDLILEPIGKKTGTFDFKPFLFDENTPKENTIFEVEFFQNTVRYVYYLELNKNSIVLEKLDFYNPNKALVFKRITDAEKQLTHIEFGSKIGIKKIQKDTLEANTLWNNTVLGGFLKTNIEAFELSEVIDWFRNNMKPIIKPRTDLAAYVSEKVDLNEINKDVILEVLKKADFNISDIIIKTDEQDVTPDFLNFLSKNLSVSQEEIKKIKDKGKVEGMEVSIEHVVNNGNTFELPFEDESAGTQRYYEFGGLLDMMIRNQSVFSIDEFESSLHPDLLKHFLLSFLVNSKDSQLVATTHLRELLMEKDIFRNDTIWFTEKKEDGSTDLFSLDDFDSSVVRNTSSVYNAYKAGKLGATPNLSDYYLDLNYAKK